ncbi:DNA polymerase III subunit chi [Sphingorhabdus sp.]|jgi:DNA polymerase-3 subunit chi|uniref:DNA polymerase III subunit chi n=1 Tax=Sphingorhabdus sp. TaxID=1902408 RepID=UPI003784F951
MQVDFYQLTRDPAEKVLPAIAQRILDNGARLLIISDDAGQLDAISAALWTARADSFLAHAKAGEGDDALQPILLSQDTDAPNGAKFVALADGNWRAVTADFERVFYLFPPEQTDNARSAWRTLGDGVERRYWKQDGGKWVQGP